jgi:hypothetical protein
MASIRGTSWGDPNERAGLGEASLGDLDLPKHIEGEIFEATPRRLGCA